MNIGLSRLAGGALVATLAASPALAQAPATARALGMGNALMGVARGNEALFLNPANLGLSGNPYWSVTLPQVSVSGTMLGLEVGDLGDLTNADDLEQARRDELLGLMPDSGTEMQMDVRLPAVAFQNRHFAFGVSYGLIGQHTFGKDIVDLLVNGYEEGRSDYSVGNTAGSRATYFDFAAGYGRKIGPLSVGVTGHYILGRTLMHSRMSEPTIDVEAQDISLEYTSVLARGGKGYGVDVGVALQPLPGVTVSAAVANAYAQMEWSEDLQFRSIELGKDDLQMSHTEAIGLRTKYERSEQPLDPNAVPFSVYQIAEGLYDESYFPTVLRAGVAWAPAPGTRIAAAYHGNLTTGRLADGWERTAGFGVEHEIPFVTVRGGFATNLEDGSMLTGGLSLGPIQVGLARLNNGEFDGAARNGWIATVGLSARTRGEMP